MFYVDLNCNKLRAVPDSLFLCVYICVYTLTLTHYMCVCVGVVCSFYYNVLLMSN